MKKGKAIGKYVAEVKIGSGSYGDVWSLLDSETNESVAAKIIQNNFLDRAAQARLHAETSLLKSVSHPNIVQLLNVFQTSNNCYIIMEHCTGGDLEDFTFDKGKVPEAVAQKWLQQIADSLIYLQSLNIMHRDVKLANILLSDDGPSPVVKLTDFGFSRFVGASSLVGTVLGTPGFMAPEVLREEKYGYKADVWSLGVIAYELMTGKPAFECETIAELLALQDRGIQFSEDCGLSEIAQNFVAALMAKESENRPSFEEARQHEFLRIAEAMPNPVLSESAPRTRDSSKNPSLILNQSRNYSMKLQCRVNHLKELYELHTEFLLKNSVFAATAVVLHTHLEFINCAEEARTLEGKFGLQENSALRELLEEVQGKVADITAQLETLPVEDKTKLGEELLAECRVMFTNPAPTRKDLKNQHELASIVLELLPQSREASELLFSA